MRLLLLLFFVGCTTTQTKPKTLEELCKEDPKADACKYLENYVPKKELDKVLAQIPKVTMSALGSSRLSKRDYKKLEQEVKDLKAVFRQERRDYQTDCQEVLK